MNPEDYGLDLHSTMLIEDFRSMRPAFEKMQEVARNVLEKSLKEAGLYVTALESRIKTEKSLAGKLERKGYKYQTLSDLTDLLGIRVITIYTDDVDKVASMVDRVFDIDWENSIDKRKMHELNSFGYNSLHYICRIPQSLYYDESCPFINEARFEVQMRTALQHVWATIDHDTGYKSDVEIPQKYLRNINRLAGMLELADEQFSIIRTGINNYRRQVQELVASGDFDEVQLNGDTFKSYLNLRPFNSLNEKIAAINQAEVHETSLVPYLPILKKMGLATLGDLDRFIKNNFDSAYKLAAYQLAITDLDIVSSTIGIQNLCIVDILKKGGGVLGLKMFFDHLSGTSDYNLERAERLAKAARQLNLIKNND